MGTGSGGRKAIAAGRVPGCSTPRSAPVSCAAMDQSRRPAGPSASAPPCSPPSPPPRSRWSTTATATRATPARARRARRTTPCGWSAPPSPASAACPARAPRTPRLEAEFGTGLHALSLRLLAPDEAERRLNPRPPRRFGTAHERLTRSPAPTWSAPTRSSARSARRPPCPTRCPTAAWCVPARRSAPCRCGKEAGLPQPADDPGFAPAGDPEERPGPLPEDKGQFGRDVATEDYDPLRPPPGAGQDRLRPSGEAVPSHRRAKRTGTIIFSASSGMSDGGAGSGEARR